MKTDILCFDYLFVLLQLQDIYSEIKLILADCLFCLASQRPLEKEDTLRLIAFLKQNGSCIADGTLDLVTLCLIITLLYCFDVSVLEDDNNSGKHLAHYKIT